MTAKANPRKSDDRNIPTVDRPVRNQRACGTLLHPVEGGFEFLIDRCRTLGVALFQLAPSQASGGLPQFAIISSLGPRFPVIYAPIRRGGSPLSPPFPIWGSAFPTPPKTPDYRGYSSTKLGDAGRSARSLCGTPGSLGSFGEREGRPVDEPTPKPRASSAPARAGPNFAAAWSEIGCRNEFGLAASRTAELYLYARFSFAPRLQYTLLTSRRSALAPDHTLASARTVSCCCESLHRRTECAAKLIVK